MKILLYSNYNPDMVDGASVTGRCLVQALWEIQIDVTVCTTDLAWSQDHIDAHCDSHKDLHLFHAWFSHILEISPRLILFLGKFIKSFDVIHFRGIFSLCTIIGSFIARRFKKPYIISIVGDRIPSWHERSSLSYGNIKYFYYQLLIRRALKGAKRIVCTSEIESKKIITLLNSNNNKVTVIPNGLDISRYSLFTKRSILENRLNIKPYTSVFLFLGRLSKEKNLEFLIAVWGKVVAQKRDSVLVIAGDNELKPKYVESLKKLIADLEFTKSVLFSGPVSGEFKRALLQHSCCLLLPSYHESFGNVVLESLASGTPAVTSTGTPWKILEGEKLGRWLPWDAKKWADAILDIAHNNYYGSESFLNHARKWVYDNFSWDNIAYQYTSLYKEIINRHAQL